jgi:hypothetical protein
MVAHRPSSGCRRRPVGHHVVATRREPSRAPARAAAPPRRGRTADPPLRADQPPTRRRRRLSPPLRTTEGGAVAEAEDAARVGRLTEAVIRSTGGAAGVTADQVEELAGNLSEMAGVDDELVQAGANVLLTFTRVRNEVGKGNDVFDRAAAAAVDMSAALGTDLQGSVIQLGKALNDPVQGLTALRRVGISFTEQQKEQIAAMQESGDLLGAQKIILGEVNREFGGAGAAGATATAKLDVAIRNLQESIGTALLPAVEAAAGGLGGMLGVFSSLPGPIQTTAVALAGLGAATIAVGLLAPKLEAARDQLEGMGRAGTFASRSIGLLGKVGLGVVAAGAVLEASDAIGKAITRIAAGPVAPVNALTKSLVELGTSGKVTGELANQLGNDLGQLGEKSSEADVSDWVRTIARWNPSLQDSIRDIDSIDKALAGLVSSGHAGVAAAALGQLERAIRSGPGGDAAADKFLGNLGDYREALNGVDVQALLTGESVDSAGDAIDSSGEKAKEAAEKWQELRNGLDDIVATDWSKQIGSNFESALNPLERFTFSTGENIGELRSQLTGAQADLDKATADLAKLQVTGTSADIARIRGQAGDIDAARAAVATATTKFLETKELLAEAQRSPLAKIGENLEGNLTGLTRWLANFEKLSAGGHESLAKHLASLGPQAADAMAEAVGASPKQLDKLQGMWDQADAKVGELVSGQFEIDAAQAARPGDTLAEILTARYQQSLVPKLTTATLAALNAATTAILDAEAAAGLPPGGRDPDAPRPTRPLPPSPLPLPSPAHPPPPTGPVLPGPPLAPQLAPVGPVPGTITFEGGINVTTLADASPREIAAETADHIAWRLGPAVAAL